MADSTSLAADGVLATRMTMRVYTVNDEGRITSDTGTREFEGTEDGTARNDNPTAFPACTCMPCRTRRGQR